MSLVSINDVLKVTTKVEKIHPYKVVGDRDSYSPYNEGWSDCVSLIESYLEKLPSAEPERKKGKWIKVHGYVTPGGDPVWKCSECGKGIHVYGIEAPSYNRDYTDGHQWVACPNCGADMEGEE